MVLLPHNDHLGNSPRCSPGTVMQFAVTEWPFRWVAEALISTQRCAMDYRVAHRGLLLDARRTIDQSCEKIWRISETANAERFGLQDGGSGEGPFDLAETVIRELGTTLIEAQVRAIRAMRPKVRASPVVQKTEIPECNPHGFCKQGMTET